MEDDPIDRMVAEYTSIVATEKIVKAAAAAGSKTTTVPAQMLGGAPKLNKSEYLGTPSAPRRYDQLDQRIAINGRYMQNLESRLDTAIRQTTAAERHALALESRTKLVEAALKHQTETNAGQDAVLAKYANVIADLTALCSKQAETIGRLQDRIDLIDSDLVLLRKG